MIFLFGALTFTVLAWTYWREKTASEKLFRWFTYLCAASFALNLVPLEIDFVRERLAGVLPPLMLQLVLVWRGWPWWILLSWLYAAALWGGAPEWVLGVSAAFGLGLMLVSKGRQRIWNAVIFAGMLAGAIGNESPLWRMLPDYLVLVFFAVWLYYRERLAFFDVFFKRGVYCLFGALALQWEWPGPLWSGLVLWLLGPLVFSKLSDWVDRWALGRRYTSLEAERSFNVAVQGCVSEQELRRKAEESLGEIFGASAKVNFAGKLDGELCVAIGGSGSLCLDRRENQVPYLSDERSLLENLGRSLEVVLENVRFRQRQAELAGLARGAELRALRAQINPHFLFNALNAIAGWIRVKPELADDTVAQLAEVFRYALNRSGQEWVQVGEEIEFIKAYLAVEQARFGDRLIVEVDCQLAAAQVMVPAMIIQPLIENAMRHGTEQVAGVGHMKLVVEREQGWLRVSVSDNGPGFQQGMVLPEGHALRNIQERLSGYFGAAANLRWENTTTGCVVRLEVPDASSDC